VRSAFAAPEGSSHRRRSLRAAHRRQTCPLPRRYGGGPYRPFGAACHPRTPRIEVPHQDRQAILEQRRRRGRTPHCHSTPSGSAVGSREGGDGPRHIRARGPTKQARAIEQWPSSPAQHRLCPKLCPFDRRDEREAIYGTHCRFRGYCAGDGFLFSVTKESPSLEKSTRSTSACVAYTYRRAVRWPRG
jgi:hypothetical protein